MLAPSFIFSKFLLSLNRCIMINIDTAMVKYYMYLTSFIPWKKLFCIINLTTECSVYLTSIQGSQCMWPFNGKCRFLKNLVWSLEYLVIPFCPITYVVFLPGHLELIVACYISLFTSTKGLSLPYLKIRIPCIGFIISTMSSCLNALSAVTWKDILEPFLGEKTETQKTWITRILGKHSYNKS
jgi:hypothetical protein